MFRHALALFTATCLTLGTAPSAQTLKFEVATLKPSAPGGQRGGIRPSPGGERYQASNISLRLMLMVAYQLKNDQILGGPSWIDTDLYDMNAKAERSSSGEELHIMLQNLLTERFRLKFHRETKELPLYALTVDKGGPKMTPHEAQSAGDPWIDQTIEQVVRVKLSALFVPMSYLAWRLGQLTDRPVSDQTNLKGGYDFTLNYTRELPPGIREGALLNGAPIDTSGPNLFEALRRELGLRLDPQKGPVEVLVIDSATRPDANE